MKTILVTGAAGFIGSAVSKALLDRGDTVIGIDDFNDYYDPSLKEARIKEFCTSERFHLHRIDIRNASAIASALAPHAIDQICHLAARAGVRASLQQPILYAETNIVGTLHLLEYARHHNIRDFIFASSSSVYGNSKRIPFTEEDPVNEPISPYAATKKACEMLAFTYHHQYGLHCTGLRFFTVYGPWGRPDMAALLFANAILAGKPLDVYNFGKMRRDFTYIDDIVAGVVAALDHAYPFEVFNLGNAHTEELLHFIELLEQYLGKATEKRLLPLAPGDVVETSANIDKSRSMLDFSPKTIIEVGIMQFVQWYKDYYKDRGPG